LGVRSGTTFFGSISTIDRSHHNGRRSSLVDPFAWPIPPRVQKRLRFTPKSKDEHMPKKGSHGRQLHGDRRTWLIVALMLAGISFYVLTLDDSLVPAGGAGGQSRTPTAPATR
jgi:hypothetical protein